MMASWAVSAAVLCTALGIIYADNFCEQQCKATVETSAWDRKLCIAGCLRKLDGSYRGIAENVPKYNSKFQYQLLVKAFVQQAYDMALNNLESFLIINIA